MNLVCAWVIPVILAGACSAGDLESLHTDTPTAAAAAVSSSPEPLQELGIEPAFPNLLLPEIVYLADPGDGTGRLFAALKPGLIVAFENDADVDAAELFLDITERANDSGNEEGLLGLAFDPAYTDNGHFYVYYSARPPRRSVLSRFSVRADDPDRADAGSEIVILEVPQPFANHNGGQIAFGPDGYLYVGLGDGGLAGDPEGNGQDTSTLLGSILRIDVGSLDSGRGYSIPPDNPFAGVAGARGEIWAHGLRNPWRFSFDRLTGELWAADVGQNDYEEVDVIRRGRNYGWDIMEGSRCFPIRTQACDTDGLEPPVAEYGHDEGCSITGGYVYRGTRLPSLYGAYVYGDYCSGNLWALRHDGSRVTEQIRLAETRLRISSFGEDSSGEVYVLSIDGRIFRFVE